MKTNISKSKALHLGMLALASSAMLVATGCSKNVNDLFFTIKGKQLEVTFCDRGASIYSIKYKNQFVTYHPKDKKTFITNNFYGKCLGRVAGRIPDGNLRIGEKEYHLDINETKGGKNNCLHGGTNGLFNKDWTHEVVEKTNYYEVTFKYLSPSGESGFPETLNIKYVYMVSKETGDLGLVINAGSSGLTPVDLSIHPFFRLGNSGDIKNHELIINADRMAQYDAEGHQTVLYPKNIEANSPWDFRNGKLIGQDIERAKAEDEPSGGYDHIWYFGNDTFNFTLSNDETNIKLNVTSPDSNAVIMYANCFEVKGQKMNDGEEDTQYAAITIEPYTFFTTEQESMEKLFINKDKSFTRHITYSFSDMND